VVEELEIEVEELVVGQLLVEGKGLLHGSPQGQVASSRQVFRSQFSKPPAQQSSTVAQQYSPFSVGFTKQQSTLYPDSVQQAKRSQGR